MEEEFTKEEKELEIYENSKENEKNINEIEAEEEKSSESESIVKEYIEEDVVTIQDDEAIFLNEAKTPEKPIKNMNFVDLSEKKLPKDIDFCRFSNDFLCEFSNSCSF